jgi:hypothetical protein
VINLGLDEQFAMFVYEIGACGMRHRMRDDKPAIGEKSAVVGKKSWAG